MISASRVREALAHDDRATLERLVPDSTSAFLMSSKPIQSRTNYAMTGGVRMTITKQGQGRYHAIQRPDGVHGTGGRAGPQIESTVKKNTTERSTRRHPVAEAFEVDPVPPSPQQPTGCCAFPGTLSALAMIQGPAGNSAFSPRKGARTTGVPSAGNRDLVAGDHDELLLATRAGEEHDRGRTQVRPPR